MYQSAALKSKQLHQTSLSHSVSGSSWEMVKGDPLGALGEPLTSGGAEPLAQMWREPSYCMQGGLLEPPMT